MGGGGGAEGGVVHRVWEHTQPCCVASETGRGMTHGVGGDSRGGGGVVTDLCGCPYLMPITMLRKYTRRARDLGGE